MRVPTTRFATNRLRGALPVLLALALLAVAAGMVIGDDVPYVASFIALAAMPYEQSVMAAAVNLNSVLVGKASFALVNKWAKLPAGQYLEAFKILAPDRVTVVVEGATRFSSEGFDRNTLVVYAIEHEFTGAGTYWVRIYLDGKLFVEYPFRVRSADEAS